MLQVPRYHGGFFAGFPGTRWTAFHIDELCGDQHGLNIEGWAERSLHEVLEGEEEAFLRKLVAEATPKAVSVAFKDDDQAPGRIPSVMEILTTILAGHGEQVRSLFCPDNLATCGTDTTGTFLGRKMFRKIF